MTEGKAPHTDAFYAGLEFADRLNHELADEASGKLADLELAACLLGRLFGAMVHEEACLLAIETTRGARPSEIILAEMRKDAAMRARAAVECSTTPVPQ